ncbi:protein LAX PANICLE 2-like isoform X2 [Rhodamnia argentea]|uniref:Protein LAX PANICLE 2-like isoform X2 n=1 Tax=Rhodamnia argentea TaxID=178133 RepID=A0ABM3HFS4_9MYRT|nr:protein LAX PANICLE 2-like isoform X2 [Rhodamnia argentea]
MTMVPAQSLSDKHRRRHRRRGRQVCSRFFGYADCCDAIGSSDYTACCGVMSRAEAGSNDYSDKITCVGGSDLVIGPVAMAEDESRLTGSLNEAAASSSKDVAHHDDRKDDEGWLQLSIGGGHVSTTIATRGENHDRTDLSVKRDAGLIELDLLSSGNLQRTGPLPLPPALTVPKAELNPSPRTPPTNFTGATTSFSTSSFSYFQYPVGGSSSTDFPHHQVINWAFRPPYSYPQSLAASPSSLPLPSSSSLSLTPLRPYFARPFQLQMGVDVAGPSSDIGIIDPPRRPHSGIWFMLQASQNQAKEPFLPQIPKSYLRIKDGRMTIRLIMKYLVNKLRLGSESEVEIRCRGQHLRPSLTLQHVRDQVWSTGQRVQAVTLLPESSTADHLMVLHYGRSSDDG